MVKVISTAKGEIKRISIDDSLMKQEEKEIAEDLIVKEELEESLIKDLQKFVANQKFSRLSSQFLKLIQ